MYKKILIYLIITMIFMISCNNKLPTELTTTRINSMHIDGQGSSIKENGIWEGNLEPKIEYKILQNRVQFIFTVKNQTERVQKLEFNTSQRFDFSIFDKNNHEIYRYSKDKLFTQDFATIVLIQGETISFEEKSPKLAEGEYSVEFWLTAKNFNVKKRIVFTLDR